MLQAVFLLLSFVMYIACGVTDDTDSKTLKHVSVVFRHADRTPDAKERFPKDPNYNNIPHVDFGGLTQSGEIREYQLGMYLKKRYGSLLDNTYLPESVYAQSTDTQITKASLKLVLAAFNPPNNLSGSETIKMSLNQKLLPMHYLPLNKDSIMFPFMCPEFLQELKRVQDSPEMKLKISKFQDFFLDLTRFTGKKISDLTHACDLYHCLIAESAMNLTLPSWTKDIFPDGKLLDAINLWYETYGSNNYQRKINGGKLLKMFIEDMENIRSGDEKRKISLYSGHEKNIVAVLQALGVYEPHIPEYSSAVIVEFHNEDDGSRSFVKVFYYLGIPAVRKLITIPNCKEECDYPVFLKLLDNVIPNLKELICDKRSDFFSMQYPSSV